MLWISYLDSSLSSNLITFRWNRFLQSHFIQCRHHHQPPCDLLMLPDTTPVHKGLTPSGIIWYLRYLMPMLGTHKASLLTPAPPRVRSAMTIPPSTRRRSRALRQVQEDFDIRRQETDKLLLMRNSLPVGRFILANCSLMNDQ